MANSIYISAAEPYSGKVLISLGVMDLLSRTIHRLGFFRPIANPYRLTGSDQMVVDRDIHLLHGAFRLDAAPEEMFGVTGPEAEALLAEGREAELHERILAAYKALEARVDFVVCEGSDFVTTLSSVEDGFNSSAARNLNAPVVVVVDGSSGDPEVVSTKARLGLEGFVSKGCQVLVVVLNQVPAAEHEALAVGVRERLGEGAPMVAAIPFEPMLATPRMHEVVACLKPEGGEVLFGSRHLENKVGRTVVASGSVETIIPLLDNQVLLVSHVDRHDVLLMAMTALTSHRAANIGGIVLTGCEPLAEPVLELLRGVPGPRIPIVTSGQNTYETVLQLTGRLRATLEPGYGREIEVARQLFQSHVDAEGLARQIQASAPRQMSPARFKYELLNRARGEIKHIVLPEGSDDRILRAADALLRLRAVELTVLGDEDAIRNRAGQLDLELGQARIVDPLESPWLDEFTELYHGIRKHRGVTRERAREAVMELPVFGTMMVHTGRADGMVAGAIHSTATTVRPAFQIIKTRPGVELVSSVFLMCLEDRVLVYGDCAVNPDPTAAELAQIAVASAETARAFQIEPVVAMLSYSTGASGTGASVEKVKEAVQIARGLAPGLALEGPIQYDAAVDVGVGSAKLPGSQVAGRATVFIFPDLNTGNNTYKAVQRSAGAVAIGPVLQGLNKPVNDLSRGCLVEDIVNTVAITAIQAQR